MRDDPVPPRTYKIARATVQEMPVAMVLQRLLEECQQRADRFDHPAAALRAYADMLDETADSLRNAARRHPRPGSHAGP